MHHAYMHVCIGGVTSLGCIRLESSMHAIASAAIATAAAASPRSSSFGSGATSSASARTIAAANAAGASLPYAALRLSSGAVATLYFQVCMCACALHYRMQR